MISVCMPYYDRWEQLVESMMHYELTYPDLDLEISICDDGSPEPLDISVSPFPTIVSHLPRKDIGLCPCTPINRAVNQSHGDLIVITNPEVFHPEPVFEEMAEAIESDDDYVIAACQDADGTWLSHSTSRGRRENRWPIPPGSDVHYCVMFRRALWERVGGFDEDFRGGAFFDDNEWLWQCEDAGANFIMRDDLVVKSQKHERSPWITTGWQRNRQLFEKKWGHKWR